MIIAGSLAMRTEARTGPVKADKTGIAVSPTGREITGRLVITEGQQGKADEVAVQTENTTFRIRPTPILNNLLNLEGEKCYRFLLERVGEGDEASWQIVRYTEVPTATSTANATSPVSVSDSEKSPGAERPRKSGKPR